jgi:glycosyltransferase involved in cell wall biosynthesis
MEGLDVTLAASILPGDDRSLLPENLLELPYIHTFPLPFYSKYSMKIPSILNCLDLIAQHAPEEIIVSTPGPVGMLGILAAKLLRIPVKGVYHTDFQRQAEEVTGNAGLARDLERFILGMYRLCDEILVPSEAYREILFSRGIAPEKLKPFLRGIDEAFTAPQGNTASEIRRRFDLTDAPVLLYTGRISHDKNLRFLLDVFAVVKKNFPTLQLLLVGDGPAKEDLEKQAAGINGVCFAGQLPRTELPRIYAGCDLLVFPSLTDTFGMTVLEAQACGLPAVVSTLGGPKEIILDGKTGFIASESVLEDWVGKILAMLNLHTKQPAVFAQMRKNAATQAKERYTWKAGIRNLAGREQAKPRFGVRSKEKAFL